MNPNSHALILAGGIGARLWPKSRINRPKQFLALDGGQSLLARTMERAQAVFERQRIWVVCKPYQLDEVKRQVPDLLHENIIIEPVPKGTAAAVLLGALTIERAHPGATLSVFPSDHSIKPVDRFAKVIGAGMEWAASNDSMVIYGIRPDHPETAYGYIEAGGTVGQCSNWNCMEVTSFHEKPDPATALAYFRSKRFLWNSGMLSFSVSVLKRVISGDSFRLWQPLYEEMRASAKPDHGRLREIYLSLPDDAFDTAVLEKLARCAGRLGGESPISLVVFPCDFDWYDLGVWESYYRMLPKDEAGNAISGTAKAIDCSGSLVISEGKTLVGAIGLKDMVVVCVGDAVLVCPRKELHRVRELVESLAKGGYERYV